MVYGLGLGLALGGVIKELAKHCIYLVRSILDIFIRILAELHASVPRRELGARFMNSSWIMDSYNLSCGSHFEESIVVWQYVLHIVTLDAFAQDDIGYRDTTLNFASLLKVLVEILQKLYK